MTNNGKILRDAMAKAKLPKAQNGWFSTISKDFMNLFGMGQEPAPPSPAVVTPSKLKIQDKRKMSLTTGKAINPNSELLTGEYPTDRIASIVRAAKRYGIDPYDAVAIDLQETGLGVRSDAQVGHVIDYKGLIPSKLKEEEIDEFDQYARAIATKMKYADKLGIKDPYVRMQTYNGLGKVFPETEEDYHGFKMKKIYGVPLPKEGIDMRKNPLYGRRVIDIRDNILKQNPELINYIKNIKQKGGPIVDPRGQWAHPGQRTIVPTADGRITMQGVPYPVYGQDETGYGQMMMPGGEYTFPGQMVDEIPMMQPGGLWNRNRSQWVDSVNNANMDKNFIKRMYMKNGPSSIQIPGQSGRSTHYMEEADGMVYPTVVQRPGSTFLEYLNSSDENGAYNYAIKTGQFIKFPNAEQASWYANNGYKTGTGVIVGKKENGGQHGGLDRWFAEKWVDVKTGKDCGRQEGEERRGYPACRPSRRVNEDTPKTASELSSAEREKFKRSKTSSERINYQHRRKEYGGEQTEQDMANKPNNPSLWSKAKSLAKQKFDVYPSAYANGWAAKWYKSKGGTWRKAEYGMEVPMMADGGKPGWLMEAQLKAQGYTGEALQQKMASMAEGGEPQNAGFQALPEYVQTKIMSNAAYGGYIPEMAAGGWAQQAAIAIAMKKAGKKPKSMQKGGEPNGEMALGQMASVSDKMNKLLQFVKPDENLDPWIASKLAVMDHSADAISDYLMYGPDAAEMQQMKNGGYTVTRSNDRKGKTHKVTGPDGTVKYFGDSKLGQHPKDPERKKAFYARHKKNLDRNPYFRAFARATWQKGGQTDSTAENILEIADPTGLSSWDDVYRSFQQSGISPETALEVLGALPLIGKAGKLTKAGLHLAKYRGLDKLLFNMLPKSNTASKALGMANIAGRGSDAVQAAQQAPGNRILPSQKAGGYVGYDGKIHQSTTPTWSGNAGYQIGGYVPEFMGGDYCYECGGLVQYQDAGVVNAANNAGLVNKLCGKALVRDENRDVTGGRSSGPSVFASARQNLKAYQEDWDAMVDPYNYLGIIEVDRDGKKQYRNTRDSLMTANPALFQGEFKAGSTGDMTIGPEAKFNMAYKLQNMIKNNPRGQFSKRYLQQFGIQDPNSVNVENVAQNLGTFGWEPAAKWWVDGAGQQDMKRFIPKQKYGGLPSFQDAGEWHPEWANDPELAFQFGYDMPVEAPAQTIPVQNTVPVQSVQAPPAKQKINYSGYSIVDLLNSVGKPSDYGSRKALAVSLGMTNYRGTAEQNKELIRTIVGNPDVVGSMQAVPRSSVVNRTASKKTGVTVHKQLPNKTAAVIAEAPVETIWDAATRVNPNAAQMAAAQNSQSGLSQWDGKSSAKAVKGKYNDELYLNRAYNDMVRNKEYLVPPGRTPVAAAMDQGILDFFTKVAPIGIGAGVGSGITWGTKLYPYGLRAIPEVVPAARHASKALPYATRALPASTSAPSSWTTLSGLAYQKGGPVVGDELEVTPEELEMLRAQGYQFEII